MALQSGKRRDAEVEPLVTLVTAPQHEFREQQIHDPSRRRGVVAHQVDGKLFLALDLPQVRKGHDGAVRRDGDRDLGAREVSLIEESEREALLPRLLVREP